MEKIKTSRKILFLGRFAPPMHGAARMNELYFEGLKKDRSFNIKKIKLNKYDSLENIGKLDKRKVVGYLQTIKELISSIRSFNPDTIYLEMAPMGIAFYKDSIFIIVSKLFRKKIIIHFHAKGVKETARNEITRRYYRFIFKNTKIILLSEILFNDIKEVVDREQVEIVHNGIPDEITDKEFKKIVSARNNNKKPIFLYLSNMIESKGPLDVLKICNELNREGTDFECNFVGKFQDEKFQVRFNKQLKDFKLQKKCKYLGAKYNEDKKKILEKANFLIFPTQYPQETFGLVIIEAFMYGIPSFSYKNASIPEIISKDFLGHASRMGDWKGLKIELKKSLKENNSQRIREEFKDKYTISISKNKIKKVIMSIKPKTK